MEGSKVDAIKHYRVWKEFREHLPESDFGLAYHGNRSGSPPIAVYEELASLLLEAPILPSQ